MNQTTAAHHLYESAGAKPRAIPGVKARGYPLELTTDETPRENH